MAFKSACVEFFDFYFVEISVVNMKHTFKMLVDPTMYTAFLACVNAKCIL